MLLNKLFSLDFFQFLNANLMTGPYSSFQDLGMRIVVLINERAERDSLEERIPLEALSLPIFQNLKLPFIFTIQMNEFICKTSSHFDLDKNEENQLKSLVFNFEVKDFMENEFGHKFIRFAFELMENRLKEIKEFENAQKKSLAKLSKGTTAPIHELEPLILNFINSQFQNYPEFKYLKNVEELINRKKEFFPEIFTIGKPKTIAYNEFILGLYLLISERNSNYMPFIKYVVDELNQINPNYFERNNISVEALRKKVKDQIKLNSK